MIVSQEQIQKIIELAKPINRGCWCDYDYRCGNCQRIINLADYIETLKLDENV